jgi:hypothetical protein
MNLADLLFASAERHSPRRAITDVRSGRSVSYGQLAREAERVAAFLKAEGVEPASGSGSWRRTTSRTCPPRSACSPRALASSARQQPHAQRDRRDRARGAAQRLLRLAEAAPLPSAPGHADESARRAA